MLENRARFTDSPQAECGFWQPVISRQAWNDGRVVYHARRGSVVPEGSKKPVHIYDLTDQQGDYVGTVYICPYHTKNSEKTPEGFRFR